MELEKGRTSGDGMEQEEPLPKSQQSEQKQRPSLHRKDSSIVQENMHARKLSVGKAEHKAASNANMQLPGLHTLYRRPDVVTRSLKPVVPTGELVPLKPRLVTSAQTLPEHKKTKPPKFVPYEPYPGAVNPIVPLPKRCSVSTSGCNTPSHEQAAGKVNKNNLDIAVLVSQMSTLRTQELNDCQTDAAEVDVRAAEIKKLREEVRNLKEERDFFQGQFKFQTQVNAELKNLLVASVGEDLQTRVNVLTEDKFQLARALLDTAKNLSTHTEQIEFLAGQCEVWRSKFLASSVMVEELARWKADLSQKNEMLTEATKQLLQTTNQIREIQLESLRNLKFLAKIRYLNLPAIDVISLSAENLNILQQMVLHSGVGMPEGNLQMSSASKNPLSETETYAVQALQFISQPLMTTDAAIKALFDQAQRRPSCSSSEPPTVIPAARAAAANGDSDTDYNHPDIRII